MIKVTREILKYYSDPNYIGSELKNAHFMAKEKMIYLVNNSMDFDGKVEDKQRERIMEAVNEPRESVLAKIKESKKNRVS
jgi:hypothetical protein